MSGSRAIDIARGAELCRPDGRSWVRNRAREPEFAVVQACDRDDLEALRDGDDAHIRKAGADIRVTLQELDGAHPVGVVEVDACQLPTVDAAQKRRLRGGAETRLDPGAAVS